MSTWYIFTVFDRFFMDPDFPDRIRICGRSDPDSEKKFDPGLLHLLLLVYKYFLNLNILKKNFILLRT